MTTQTVTTTIKATQWFKLGDHPRVINAGPMVYKKGGFYYITGMMPQPEFWLSIETFPQAPTVETGGIFAPSWVEFKPVDQSGEKYVRKLLPFNFWDVKGEKSETEIAETDLLYLDYFSVLLQWRKGSPFALGEDEVRPYGRLQPPLPDRVVIYPGEWIVEHPDGRMDVLSDKDFQKHYGGAK